MTRLDFVDLVESLYISKEPLNTDEVVRTLLLDNSISLSVVGPFKIHKVNHSDKYLTVSTHGIYNLRTLLDMIKFLDNRKCSYSEIARLLNISVHRVSKESDVLKTNINIVYKDTKLVSNAIRHCLTVNNFSSVRLAKEADLSKATISGLLNGTRALTEYTAAKLSKVLTFSKAEWLQFQYKQDTLNVG